MAFSISLPSDILEFSNSKGDWIQTEIDTVRAKWAFLFADVTGGMNALNQNPCIPVMLKEEIEAFERLCEKLYAITAPTASILLALNHLRWEVLILASLWDLRLMHLHSNVITKEDDLSKLIREDDGWMWKPFTDIRNCCIENLYSAYSPLLGKLTQNLLAHSRDLVASVSQIVFEEGCRLHIPLSNAYFMVSNFQGEISSYIACGLSLEEYYSPQTLHFGSEVIHRSAHHLKRLIPSYASLSKKERDHEISFGVEQFPMVKCSVVIVCANQFRAFRQQCCTYEESYIASLSRCRRWDAQGGKSKALFAKTLDDRLVIKEIEKSEVDLFVKFSSDYFRHMRGSETCLAKILGIYQLTFTQHGTNNREKNCSVMVMENLFFDRNIHRMYDLKGTLNSARELGGSSDVFLDIKFVADMDSSPIYLEQSAKTLLNQVILRDTQFLEANNIMDYSLLLGVDENQKQLVCGIIDYLQQYSFNKQLETLFKSSIKSVSPTIVPPENYADRFRAFINTTFRTS